MDPSPHGAGAAAVGKRLPLARDRRAARRAGHPQRRHRFNPPPWMGATHELDAAAKRKKPRAKAEDQATATGRAPPGAAQKLSMPLSQRGPCAVSILRASKRGGKFLLS